jgi:hypothetical protein
LKGFYWRSDGFYDSLGQALAVPAGPANEQNLVSSLILYYFL